MPSTGFLSSLVGSGIAQLIAAIAGFAAIYMYFITFVQSDEMAVRSRNNEPDTFHEKMSWKRRAVIWLGIGGLITTIVLIVKLGTDQWHIWTGLVLISIVSLWRAIVTWPRTSVLALQRPGFKIKVPGWVNYKSAKIAKNTRTINVTERTDADGELVNVDVTYVWARGTRELRDMWQSRQPMRVYRASEPDEVNRGAEHFWTSLFGVDNLEDSLDGIVRAVALMVIGETPSMKHLDAEGIRTFCAALLDDVCTDALDKFGATVYEVRIGRVGPPAQVTAMEKLVRVLAELREQPLSSRG